MSKDETVKLTVEIPKCVMDFFEVYWRFVGYKDQTAKEYLIEHMNRYGPSLIQDVVFDEIRDHQEAILENHGLEPYRELMGFPKRKEAEAK